MKKYNFNKPRNNSRKEFSIKLTKTRLVHPYKLFKNNFYNLLFIYILIPLVVLISFKIQCVFFIKVFDIYYITPLLSILYAGVIYALRKFYIGEDIIHRSLLKTCAISFFMSLAILLGFYLFDINSIINEFIMSSPAIVANILMVCHDFSMQYKGLTMGGDTQTVKSARNVTTLFSNRASNSSTGNAQPHNNGSSSPTGPADGSTPNNSGREPEITRIPGFEIIRYPGRGYDVINGRPFRPYYPERPASITENPAVLEAFANSRSASPQTEASVSSSSSSTAQPAVINPLSVQPATANPLPVQPPVANPLPVQPPVANPLPVQPAVNVPVNMMAFDNATGPFTA